MAEPLRFSVSAEEQSFYLSPKSSANFFSKYEFKTFGQYDLARNLRFKTDFSVNYVQLNRQDQKQIIFNPNEVGFVGSAGFLDYQLGSWTFTPEGTDLNNIFDVIHAKDYRQPFNSENLASVGILLKSHFSNLDLNVFFIPKNRKSLLPDTQSPWWPRTDALPMENSSGTFYLPENTAYVYRNETVVNNAFDQNGGASAKLSFSFIDFHAFYFSGANQIPQISPHLNIDLISLNPMIGNIRAPLDIDLSWIKSDHLGAGFSASFDPVIVKSFCKNEKDYYADETANSTSCTAAVESGFSIYKSTFHYFLQVNRLWRQHDVSQELETLLGFFDKSTAFGFLVDVGADSNLSGAIIYNEKSPSVLSSLRYEVNWTDRLKTALGVNIITVGSEPLTKSYDATDNATLKISYNF